MTVRAGTDRRARAGTRGRGPAPGRWVRERIGTLRAVLAAAAAWSASLAAGVPVLLLAGACTALGALLVLRVRAPAQPSAARRRGRPSRGPASAPPAPARSALAGGVLLLAGAAGLLAGAHAHATAQAPHPETAVVRIIADPQTTATGLWRTIGTGEFGRATLLSRDQPPAAGTTVRAHLDWWDDDFAGLEQTAVLTAPGPQWRVRARLRDGLVTAAGAGTGAHTGTDLLPGLVVGDTAHVDPELTDAMRTVSLTHVTAVSGSNITIVAGVVLLASAALRWPWSLRLLPTAAVTAGYVFVVGPEPSVLRATAMAALLAVGYLRPTGTPTLALLASAVTLLLIGRPHLATEIGFGLSVCATAALVVLAPPLTRRLCDRGVPRLLAAALAVPTAAQLGCAPLLIVLDPRMSPWSIAANALAGPAVAPATVLGLCALALEGAAGLLRDASGGALPVLTGPLTVLARATGGLGAAAAWWITLIARCCARLPGASVGWPGGVGGIAVSLGLVLGIAILLLARRRLRGLGLVVACACAIAGVGAPLLTASGRGAWSLLVCDVGQGSAALLRSRDGPRAHALLVDTGDDPERLQECLRGAGLTRLTIALSHFDRDHVGALPTALAAVDEARVLIPQALAATADAQATAQTADVAPPLTAGQSVDPALVPPGVTVEVLWPPLAPRSAEDGNAASLVLLVEVDGLRVLLPGDVGEREQLRLVTAIAQRPPVDVLVAPHHGSGDMAPAFFRAARPRAGLVSVGADNTYGHPATRALAAFGSIPVLRTDECGSIALTAELAMLGDGPEACTPRGR